MSANANNSQDAHPATNLGTARPGSVRPPESVRPGSVRPGSSVRRIGGEDEDMTRDRSRNGSTWYAGAWACPAGGRTRILIAVNCMSGGALLPKIGLDPDVDEAPRASLTQFRCCLSDGAARILSCQYFELTFVFAMGPAPCPARCAFARRPAAALRAGVGGRAGGGGCAGLSLNRDRHDAVCDPGCCLLFCCLLLLCCSLLLCC